jgi:hypothetical protein
VRRAASRVFERGLDNRAAGQRPLHYGGKSVEDLADPVIEDETRTEHLQIGGFARVDARHPADGEEGRQHGQARRDDARQRQTVQHVPTCSTSIMTVF